MEAKIKGGKREEKRERGDYEWANQFFQHTPSSKWISAHVVSELLNPQWRTFVSHQFQHYVTNMFPKRVNNYILSSMQERYL
jgi:hypothetical protein